MFDNDLYKFTMQQAVLEHFPSTIAEYEFVNRGSHCFSKDAIKRIKDKIILLSNKKVKNIYTIFNLCPYFKPHYLEYLNNYRYRLEDLNILENPFRLKIKGHWHRTILWEVPLMAIISEEWCKSTYGNLPQKWHEAQLKLAASKAVTLYKNGCNWVELGTRRRRAKVVHDKISSIYKDWYLGTSNLEIARKHRIKPIGTMAHEWIMGCSALDGLRHANKFALQRWMQTYQGQLGIALTDTYGTRAFFNDFDPLLARCYDGLRQDSGCPFDFTDRAYDFYKSLDIEPSGKTIVYSDSLNVDKCIKIQKYKPYYGFKKIYGIGTNITNDFEGQPPMNIVIKLRSVDGIEVCKLSDVEGKESGSIKSLDIAKQIFKP